MNILDRFLNYVKIPTTSNEEVNKTPSTECQKNLAQYLTRELNNIGVSSVFYDEEHCYVYAYLKGNSYSDCAIGFISHMDTSSGAKGEDIKPNIIKNYNGKDIELENGNKIDIVSYPDLKNHIGKTLITTDGTTLLGADDKAGIAEIMTMLEYFKTTSDKHGDIYVAFTPDEEIGRGTKFFDFDKFKADIAYTVDGEDLGEISYENFNAANVTIEISGIMVHPGYAKNKMINSLLLALAINEALPNEIPSNTEGYEGFYYLSKLTGDVNYSKMEYAIRDHDKNKFEHRKQVLKSIVKKLNKQYGNRISINIQDRYYNMKDVISGNMKVVENVINSTKKLNIKPIIKPIRGGTDGSSLSYKGLPCPNLGAGGHNFHSIYEYIALEDMQKVSQILIEIVKSYTKNINNQKENKNYIKNK